MQTSRFSVLLFSFFVILCAASAVAQNDDDAAAIRREHWVAGALVSGGTGLIDRTYVHFTRAGFRVGRVMTGELGTGLGRGTFELDAEITPLDYVLWGRYRDVYGFGVNPLVMKWNFTRGRKTIPYILTQGGMVHTKVKIPPGNTSTVNFTSGAGVGFNHFIKPGRSVNFDVRATHLSNASLGDHNPGVNASLQFSIGYNWWKQ
jgi:lipid A 3-O-deacylase